MISIKKLLLSILLGISLGGGLISGTVCAAETQPTEETQISETQASESESESVAETEDPLLEILDTDIISTTDVKVYSRAALIMDADTGEVLYYKNPDDTHYPASITKLMTAYIAMQETDMDEEIVISQRALDTIDWESSQLGVYAGQTLTMEEALYSLMLASANDVANAIGEHISGTQEEFVALMNYYAKMLGCSVTRFANAHGMHDANHFTTVYEATLFARACLSIPEFTDICSTYSYKIETDITRSPEETEKLKKEYNGEIPKYFVSNHHKMVNGTYKYEYAFGGKTGYTKEARNCLSTYATDGKHRLICTVFDCPGGDNYIYKDTEVLFDYCFEHYDALSKASTRKAGSMTYPVPYTMNYNNIYIAKHTLPNIKKIAALNSETVLAHPQTRNYILNNYLLYVQHQGLVSDEEESSHMTFTEKAAHIMDFTDTASRSNDEIIVGILILALIIIVVLFVLIWLIKLSRRKYKRIHYKTMKRRRRKAEADEHPETADWDSF